MRWRVERVSGADAIDSVDPWRAVAGGDEVSGARLVDEPERVDLPVGHAAVAAFVGNP